MSESANRSLELDGRANTEREDSACHAGISHQRGKQPSEEHRTKHNTSKLSGVLDKETSSFTERTHQRDMVSCSRTSAAIQSLTSY